ncbi:MAG: hypothetical protein AAFV29_20850, partial [Myxococcota bacterium]
MTSLLQGAAYAAGVVVIQVALAQLLGGIEPGARAQGVGAVVSALLMISAGMVLGLRRRGIVNDVARSDGELGASHALLDAGVSSRTWHWDAVATAAILSVIGLSTYFLGGLAALMPDNAAAPSGVGRAMFATDAVVLVGLVLVNLGYALGINAPRGALRSSAVGYVVFVSIAVTLGYVARFVSYEATTIAGTAAA